MQITKNILHDVTGGRRPAPPNMAFSLQGCPKDLPRSKNAWKVIPHGPLKTFPSQNRIGLVRRAGGDGKALRLDSLQSTVLAELIRKELRRRRRFWSFKV